MIGPEWCSEPSWIRTISSTFYSFLVATSVFIAGTGLGVVATALLVYDPRDPNEDDSDTEISYENRYYDMFFDESTDPITTERTIQLQGVHVEEETPQGAVRMEWDDETKTFIWYAVSGVPHTTLEAVARKFVCDNKCACLYHNIYDSYYEENERYAAELKDFRETKASSPQVSPASSTEDFVVVKDKDGKVSPVPSPAPTKSVFATFRDYSGKSVAKNGTEDAELTLIREKHDKNMVRIKANMNRFRRGGTPIDHDVLVKERNAPPPAPSSKISFGMFKRMRGSTEQSVSATN